MGLREKIENRHLPCVDFITVVRRQKGYKLFFGPNSRVFDAKIVERGGKPVGLVCYLENGKPATYILERFYICVNGKWVGWLTEDKPPAIYRNDEIGGVAYEMDITVLEAEGKALHDAAMLALREAKKGNMTKEEYKGMTAEEYRALLTATCGAEFFNDDGTVCEDENSLHADTGERGDKKIAYLTAVDKSDNVVKLGPREAVIDLAVTKAYNEENRSSSGTVSVTAKSWRGDVAFDPQEFYICIDGAWVDGEKPDSMLHSTHAGMRPLSVDEAVNESKTADEILDETEFHLTVVEKDYSGWIHENVVTIGPKQKVYGLREAVLPGGFRGIRASYKPNGEKIINVDLNKHYICIDGVWMDGQKPDNMFYTHSSERPDFKELNVDDAVREDENLTSETEPDMNPSSDMDELINALKTIKNACREHMEQGGACATCPMSLCGDVCSIAKRPYDWTVQDKAREVVMF